MQQRLPSLADPPIAFAHRGARAHAPENTIEAFSLALKLGATGLESDVWLTSDRVPVLDHDGLIRNRFRRTPISELTRSQLPGHIPSLEQLLDTCGTDYALSLDLKGQDTGERVLEMIRSEVPSLLPRLWLCDPEWERLLALRPIDDTVKLVDSTRLNRIKEGAERRAATLAERGIDALNMHHSDWSGGLVVLLHRFGRYALGWDMQLERHLHDGFRMGLDGVYSDWVDRMMDAYAAEIG